MSGSEAWGRIADDGTVFVRLPDGGERAIGSWQAGSAEEGLAFYTRRYDDLTAEVAVLEGRLTAATADPKAIAAAARKLRGSLPEVSVIGDLGALDTRLGGVLEGVDRRLAELAEERAQAAAAAVEAKRALVEEAERLRESAEWRATTERFRAIVEEWKKIRVDRRTDTELWERFAAARKQFDHRRRAHFAELDKTRATIDRGPSRAESSILGRIPSMIATASSSLTSRVIRHGSIPAAQHPSAFHRFPMPATVRWSSST